jgi:hypothetical protein
MSEVTDLAVIDIKPEQAPALYAPNGLDAYLEQIRQAVNEVPDLSTKKGRDRVASLAASVSRSKTAIEKPGREYLRRLKEAVKPAEVEIKRFVDACDTLRDETRRPLTEWEVEQERIKAEEEAKKKAEELALKIEADHEMALLMNKDIDRDREEQRRLAEQAQRERDEQLKREAAEQAQRDAEAKAKADIEAAARREAEATAAAQRAEHERIESEQRAEREKKEAAEKAEREKQDAIEAERRKAQEEADRVKREAEQKEQARLAEEKRKADEEARRTADVEHRRTVNRRVIADLIAQGIPEEFAQKAMLAIAGGKVADAHIKY